MALSDIGHRLGTTPRECRAQATPGPAMKAIIEKVSAVGASGAIF